LKAIQDEYATRFLEIM